MDDVEGSTKVRFFSGEGNGAIGVPVYSGRFMVTLPRWPFGF
jgi:hypothetical protein